MSRALKTAAIDVKYEAGHSYHETWESTDYYCPACGAKEVWHETSGGDYYMGETHLCRACSAHFFLPRDPAPTQSYQDNQRLIAIRGVT